MRRLGCASRSSDISPSPGNTERRCFAEARAGCQARRQEKSGGSSTDRAEGEIRTARRRRRPRRRAAEGRSALGPHPSSAPSIFDCGLTLAGRARARLDRRADARPAARDRGGARCTGPARVLPLCPKPVVPAELPGGDGRAVARAAVLSGPALEVEELRHRYGERIALDGVSLRVERGELFGLLGPNGGGKSTLFRILSTLLAAGGGAARVLGHDVAREPDRVRRRLGVVFQHASVDRTLTVEENLVHHGHLYGLSGASL